MVNKDDVLATLRAHEAELKSAGIVRLSVFGSVARGETGNDVDLLAAFDDAHRLSLVDVVGLEHLLEDLLGAEVDLAQEGTLKDGMRERIERSSTPQGCGQTGGAIPACARTRARLNIPDRCAMDYFSRSVIARVEHADKSTCRQAFRR